jgi:hypothetical protein
MASDATRKKPETLTAKRRRSGAECPASHQTEALAGKTLSTSEEARIAGQTKPSLLTVRQFAEKHPAFTVGGLRFYIFMAQSNGFEKALVRLGRRVLLDEAKVFQWIDSQQRKRV